MFYVLIIFCVILTIYFIKKRSHDYWKKRNIKQVENIMWQFVKDDRSIPEIIRDIYNENDTVVGTFSGIIPVLVLKDLDDIQAVLAGDFLSFYSRGIDINPNDFLADNLLFMDDYKKWRLLRHKVSPVFTSAKLKNMFYILDKCGKKFSEHLEVQKELKKPYEELHKYTTAALAASVFGIDTFPEGDMNSPFVEITKNSTELNLGSFIGIVITSLFPKMTTWLNLKIFGNCEEFFIGAVRKVLDSRRDDTVKRHDFIDICLELQKQGTMRDVATGYELEPSVEVLAGQAFFFFLAGADSSANTMHFTLLALSAHQDILAKVHKEIDSVFEDDKEELTYNDVEKLQYLSMVLSESIRMYPTIGSFQRKCTKDTVLPGSNTKVYKDEVVMISTYGIHRDEKYFENPNVFDPERFAPGNEETMNKYSLLGFGEGNRVCIGARFARLQLIAGLAWVLRKFTLAEQEYAPNHYEKNLFSIRDTKARYQLIPRNV